VARILKEEEKEMKKKWKTFEEARKFAHSLKLKSNREWREYHKSDIKPKDIPSNPVKVYSKEWTNWGDWLGTGKIQPQKRTYLSFKKAKEFVSKLKLKNRTEWYNYLKSGKKPLNIPSNPEVTYKEFWKNWGDWLGTGYIHPKKRKYRNFIEARRYVQSLNISSLREWQTYYKSNKKPADIPSAPWRTYKQDGWKSLGDWLATGTIAPQLKQYRPCAEAKQFVRSLGLKNNKEWFEYCKSGKKPDDIPTNPWVVYSKERFLRNKK